MARSKLNLKCKLARRTCGRRQVPQTLIASRSSFALLLPTSLPPSTLPPFLRQCLSSRSCCCQGAARERTERTIPPPAYTPVAWTDGRPAGGVVPVLRARSFLYSPPPPPPPLRIVSYPFSYIASSCSKHPAARSGRASVAA